MFSLSWYSGLMIATLIAYGVELLAVVSSSQDVKPEKKKALIIEALVATAICLFLIMVAGLLEHFVDNLAACATLGIATVGLFFSAYASWY